MNRSTGDKRSSGMKAGQKCKLLLGLFLSYFKIGLFTFGGG